MPASPGNVRLPSGDAKRVADHTTIRQIGETRQGRSRAIRRVAYPGANSPSEPCVKRERTGVSCALRLGETRSGTTVVRPLSRRAQRPQRPVPAVAGERSRGRPEKVAAGPRRRALGARRASCDLPPEATDPRPGAVFTARRRDRRRAALRPIRTSRRRCRRGRAPSGAGPPRVSLRRTRTVTTRGRRLGAHGRSACRRRPCAASCAPGTGRCRAARSAP